MIITTEIISGKVSKDIYGSWDDCDPGLYIGNEMVETIFRKYRGKVIKLSIEIIEGDL